MLKVRVIPTLLWKEFGLVKGAKFDSWRRVGPVLPAVKVYNQREVDELVLVDITAHAHSEELDYESVEDFARDCFVPFTVGGGIRSVTQVQRLLHAGADKICINSAAYDNARLVTDVAMLHGSQCVVASIDVRQIGDRWVCFRDAGSKDTGYDVLDWAEEMCDRGAGELLITSIDRDGTFEGYDMRLIESVVKAVDIPVIASGGAGSYQDMVDVVVECGASAVAAASIFHFTQLTPAGAKEALKVAGIPTRENYRDFG